MAFSMSQTLNPSPQWLCFQQIVKQNLSELQKKRAKANYECFHQLVWSRYIELQRCR